MDEDVKKQLRGVYEMLGKMFASDEGKGSTLEEEGPEDSDENDGAEVMDCGADQQGVQEDGKSVKKAMYAQLLAKKSK